MQIWESATEDSYFEYGLAVRELRTGRHSKEGTSLAVSSWAGSPFTHGSRLRLENPPATRHWSEAWVSVDAEGSPVDTWLVRIVGGTVAGSAKGKPQWKYVALLKSDEYDEASDTVQHNWYYSPLQKVTPLVPIKTERRRKGYVQR